VEADAVLGCVVLVAALGVMSGLVIWSRIAIDRIAEKKQKSVRDIVRGLGDER